ncbi:MAG TPA: T9SS type A sorting domain-containing protein, partial [Nitrosomonas sp.]|nr:T9SS type A sorting domain-containing protein [Nitrosomonas sp.]
DFNLYQNFPNPFNPITKIKYAVGSRQYITLKVYDVLGNEIVTLVNEVQQAGEYEIEFNAEKYSLSSGVYFYKLKTEGGELSRKMILLK